MKKLSSFLTLMLILSMLVVPVYAKDINLTGTPNAQIDSSAIELESIDYSLGYRSVSIDGSEASYDSDINLNQGLRLLSLDLTLVPGNEQMNQYLDVARFNLGDIADPTPTYKVQAKKYGLYDLNVKRSERDYVYDNNYEHDYHSYDFTRTNDSMDLTITPEGLPKFFISKNQLDREGMSISTRHLQNENYASIPIDEISDDTTVGTEFTYAGFDVYLAHTQDNYDGVIDVDDVNPIENGSTYTKTYKSDEVRNLNTQIDNLAIHKVVNNRLDLTLTLEDARGEGAVDSSTTKESRAAYEAGHSPTTLYSDSSLTTEVGYALKDESTSKQYSGTSESSSFKGSLDATYKVSGNTYLHGGYKLTETEYDVEYQSTEHSTTDYLATYDGNTYYYDTDDGVESITIEDVYDQVTINNNHWSTTNEKDKFYIEGEHYFNDNLKVGLGYLNNQLTEYEDGSKHGEVTEDGFKVSTIYEPLNNVRIDAEYTALDNEEDGEKVSDNDIADVKVDWEVANNLTLTGKYKKDNEEGAIGAWIGSGHVAAERTSETKTLAVAYQPLTNLQLDFSYSKNAYETSGTNEMYYGSSQSDYTTESNNDIYSLNAGYQVNEELNASFYSTYVDGIEEINVDAKPDAYKPFENEYKDYGVNLTQAISADMDVTLDYRKVEYDEQEVSTYLHGTNANDYSADIITLGLEGGF